MFTIFFVISLIILIGLIFFTFSTLKIDIENLSVSNYNNNKLEIEYIINLKLYLFKKIRYLKLRVDKERIAKIKFKPKLDFNKIKEFYKKLKARQIKFDAVVEKLNFELKIDTIDLYFTSFVVFILSTFLSIILSKFICKTNYKNCSYTVLPIYQNKNLIDFKLNSIIEVKMVHIISVIHLFLVNRKGKVKNERTSNRKINDDSDEQYKNNGGRRYNYRRINSNFK